MSAMLVRNAIAALGLLASSFPSLANVVYEVTVGYGAFEPITYEFSMEFADASGVKTERDLVGGDFFGERLTAYGTRWNLEIDDTPILLFDPAAPHNIWFISADWFTRGAGCNAFPFMPRYIEATCSEWNIYTFEAHGDITVRVAGPVVLQAVPAPGTLALVGLGALAAAASRRRKQSKV